MLLKLNNAVMPTFNGFYLPRKCKCPEILRQQVAVDYFLHWWVKIKVCLGFESVLITKTNKQTSILMLTKCCRQKIC